jgi:hypothetical protein
LKNDKINTQEKLNIVLSPSFYWFKQEQLPVKNATQAKKLIPSLFDTNIPEGNYNYMAIKKEDTFWIFAYDDAMIAGALLEAGIKPSQIKNIYFAQTEIAQDSEPIRVDDTFALMSYEGCISMVPLAYADAKQSVQEYFKSHSLSKHTVGVNLFQNSVIDEKYLYRLMALSIVFIIIYLANYIVLRNDFKQERVKEYLLEKKYQLPETSFERKSLKRSLESKQQRQIALREKLKTVMSLSFGKDEYIKKLEFSEKKFHLEIVMNAPKRAEFFKNSIQKMLKITSAKVVDKTFYIGGKI